MTNLKQSEKNCFLTKPDSFSPRLLCYINLSNRIEKMIEKTKNMSPLSKNLFGITMNHHQSKTVILLCILKLQTCAYDVKPAIVYSRFNYVGICIVNKQTNSLETNTVHGYKIMCFFLFVHKLCRITPQMRCSRRHPHHSHEVFIDFHPAPTLRNFI